MWTVYTAVRGTRLALPAPWSAFRLGRSGHGGNLPLDQRGEAPANQTALVAPYARTAVHPHRRPAGRYAARLPDRRQSYFLARYFCHQRAAPGGFHCQIGSTTLAFHRLVIGAQRHSFPAPRQPHSRPGNQSRDCRPASPQSGHCRFSGRHDIG